MVRMIDRVRRLEQRLRDGGRSVGMAITVVLIVAWAAGCQATPTPVERGTPTQAPTEAATEAPTESPAAEETPAATSDTAEDFPSAAEEELLSHIPESFDCFRSDFGAGVGLAAIGCDVSAAGGDISLTYHLFASEEDMYGAYDDNLAFMGVGRDAGPCESTWPAEEAYTIGGEDAGRVACVDFGVGYIISWTDDRLLIKGYAEGFDVDQQEFLEWWSADSGPI